LFPSVRQGVDNIFALATTFSGSHRVDFGVGANAKAEVYRYDQDSQGSMLTHLFSFEGDEMIFHAREGERYFILLKANTSQSMIAEHVAQHLNLNIMTRIAVKEGETTERRLRPQVDGNYVFRSNELIVELLCLATEEVIPYTSTTSSQTFSGLVANREYRVIVRMRTRLCIKIGDTVC